MNGPGLHFVKLNCRLGRSSMGISCPGTAAGQREGARAAEGSGAWPRGMGRQGGGGGRGRQGAPSASPAPAPGTGCRSANAGGTRPGSGGSPTDRPGPAHGQGGASPRLVHAAVGSDRLTGHLPPPVWEDLLVPITPSPTLLSMETSPPRFVMITVVTIPITLAVMWSPLQPSQGLLAGRGRRTG